MYDGLQRDFRTPLTVGIVLSLALAVVADLLLVLAQRLATPWARAGRAARRGRRPALMGFFGDVFDFLTNHDQWHGDESIPRLLGQHLQLTVVSVLVAALVALPIGIVLGHVRTGGAIAVNIANIGRALPAFALLILAVQWVGIGDPTGVLTPVQSVPAFIAMFALAVPPMLANAYVGMASVDDEIRESARGHGHERPRR